MSETARVEVRPAGTQAPRRRWLLVTLSCLAGFLLTVVWSASFVDTTIGGAVTDTLLGEGAGERPLAGAAAGVVFAFVSGLAGTFTACNIAVFGAVAPMVSEGGQTRRLLAPLGWLGAGMTAVSALYGAVVGAVGVAMPQFSTAQNVAGALSPRSIQSMVVFGVIGLAMLYLGLAAIGLVPDPFARAPRARLVFLGALIGGFLIGRPFPLFRHLFRHAAESGNPLYGAAAFTLQSLGNVVLMAVLFLIVARYGGGLRRWLQAEPGRVAAVTAATLIVAGVFTFLYWDLRLLARREIIPWYPVAPWS
ncbi:MFS family permease [Nonomuraea thailandensis]|uniref:MFS family permease n=1 Tax=Nonomuraea thailandensis TaxID=1188745 RepID=A0A9X2K371_9ACTN|nr:hypothetical protein [Nonomuraea thailandensis]MCP2357805.1 MFS family permease [Nonomuraea thailandensis]